ncbi:hypothetical protein D3C74_468800 [compost metagenome]
MFGGSVHWIDEETGLLTKEFGDRLDNILNEWDIVDLPPGYEVCENGGVKKVKNEN